MSTFNSQILTLAHAGKGYVIKQGKQIFNPTVREIDVSLRKLSANVQGAICQTLKDTSYEKPQTSTGYHRVGSNIFPFVICFYDVPECERGVTV